MYNSIPFNDCIPACTEQISNMLVRVEVRSHYGFFLHFCLQFDANAKNGLYTHTQTRSVNGPLVFDSTILLSAWILTL